MSTVTIEHVTRIAHEVYATVITPEHIALAGATSPNAKALADKGSVNLSNPDKRAANLATIVTLSAKAAGYKGLATPKSDPVWVSAIADCETRNRKAGAEKAKATAKPKGKGKPTPAPKGDATLTARVDSLEAKLDLILAALAPKA